MQCSEALSVGASFCSSWIPTGAMPATYEWRPRRWQALLETMERDLMASYHCEPLLPNGISKQLPQHFVTMLVAVRSLEELLASWPRTIQGKTMHLKGLLRHAGTLTVSYIGKFHLKQIQIPFDFDKPPCEKTMQVYNDFMVDFTTELEDVADFVTTWHSFLHEAAQMKHEQTLCSCELALEQATTIKESRHMLQLFKFIGRITGDIARSTGCAYQGGTISFSESALQGVERQVPGSVRKVRYHCQFCAEAWDRKKIAWHDD